MSDLKPAPKLSATILLLRDAEDETVAKELEVLMVARHYQIDFASGALVFPGGKVMADDSNPAWQDDGLIAGNFVGNDLVARIAAVRETFEEAGLLLARHKSAAGVGMPLVGQDIAEALGPFRSQVDRGELAFSDLIAKHDLVLALDTLVHFAHWVTPEMMPKRFDTHFYLAVTPPAQSARHDGRETTDAIWISPDEAISRADAGTATIIFPTRMNLHRLALASSSQEAHDRFEDDPVITVTPQMDKMPDGRPCLRIPEVEGYPVTLEPLENIKA